MQQTIDTWNKYKMAWNGVRNFMLAGECIPFSYQFPPLEQIVEELRQHPDSSIRSGIKADAIQFNDIKEVFCKAPLEEALKMHFSLVHFRLSNFDAPGKCLFGFREQVLDPWQNALREQGFTWARCYPIIFISGANSATNYHMDFSHVLAWQVYGHKRFCGLREPERWVSHLTRVTYSPAKLSKPAELTEEDTLCYDMHPGDALWNALLTPHWVEASTEVAMSINISHGGLRLNGSLSPFEQELMEWCTLHPDQAPHLPTGMY